VNNTALQPVDIDHLNRYTGGDRDLNIQILGLFDGQCREILIKLEAQIAAPEGQDVAKAWKESAHALKGAARGIGAFSLAESASDAEKIAISDHKAVLEVLERLKARAATVHAFIDELISARN
jgi:HPt (histidine-containing phosphotransfer) domain-containing protein